MEIIFVHKREKDEWCPRCGGGGSDDTPPYVGICWVCEGSGEISSEKYKQTMNQQEVSEILQVNRENAWDLEYEADFMVVATEDDSLQKRYLKDKAEFLEKVVETWFKDFVEDDTEGALAWFSKFGPSLENAWVSRFEGAGV